MSFPKIKIDQKRARTLLFLILSFSLVSRLLFLGNPTGEYFDEVYHAFTAREILHGNPEAWEWWNTPPEGFAYEWTHPPLAKLGMVLGMKLVGENSFGWRFPGALLGTLSVFLVYLLGKQMFKDEALGLIAAGVLALDGLHLVMSRIGMNDAYLLFFSLLAVYLFLKEKNFFSAMAFGFAISSKWSAIWVLPILFFAHIIYIKKWKMSYLWFLVLPLVVYLASYIPFFLSGHGLETFIDVQKQMWWYHTGLEATHAYTSNWWSWPLMLRPIYLYTSDEAGGMVSRIYAMGNPFIFWGGLAAFTHLVYKRFSLRIARGLKVITNFTKPVNFAIFSYLVFFVPWAASPRIMFLYHYLPSLPFLAILVGFVLRKYPRLIKPFFLIAFLVYLYFFPHWAGINIPLSLDSSYYIFSGWR